MKKYKEVEGCLIAKALSGEFDVIGHGCNCFCTQRNGIAPLMVKAFETHQTPLEDTYYKGDVNKLGQIDWFIPDEYPKLIVVNCYTQYNYSRVDKPLDYEALTLCMRKINHQFKGKYIGLPLIGCGLAGGIWDKSKLTMHDQMILEKRFHKDVKTIIQEELKDCDVTIVHFKP